MPTKSGTCYPFPSPSSMEDSDADLKYGHASPEMLEGCRNSAINHFNNIPDELVTCILSKLSSTSYHFRDFFGALLVCKRFKVLSMQPAVLQCASQALWTSRNISFIQKCADAGNVEACYTLGILRFYFFKQWADGIFLLEKAAKASHSRAMYSMAIIKFNGSGGAEEDIDLEAALQLCERAASLGHMAAAVELGICNVFGIKRDRQEWHWRKRSPPNYFNFDSQNVIVQELCKWFSDNPPGNGLKLCSNIGCRRPETRKNEFRPCPFPHPLTHCRNGFYCSWVCWYIQR